MVQIRLLMDSPSPYLNIDSLISDAISIYISCDCVWVGVLYRIYAVKIYHAC
jgi:hypothetical protein